MSAGVYGATGVPTALRVAGREGRGQVVDLSLFEPIFATIASEAAKCRIRCADDARRQPATHTAPRNVYACRDGAYVALSGSTQSMALRIVDTVVRPDLKTDPRFATNDARVQHRDAPELTAPSPFAGCRGRSRRRGNLGRRTVVARRFRRS